MKSERPASRRLLARLPVVLLVGCASFAEGASRAILG